MDEGVSTDSPAEWTVGPLGVRSAAITLVVGTGVREGVFFLAPLLVTVLLAYAIEPFVNECSRLGFARPLGIGGERAQKKLTYDVIKAIDRQIEKYLVARALISGIVAAATWFGLWMLGVRQPLVLGLIAGALNIIPFIGPVVAVAPTAIVAFVQFHTIGMTAVVVGVTGAIAAVEGNLVSPWLTGRAGELDTVAVFVSVLFWGWMWDVWGLVLAVPIMVAVKAAADHIGPLQPLGELLGR